MEKADHFFSHLDKDFDGEIEFADFLTAVQHEAEENQGSYWLPEAAAITESEEREKTFLQKLQEMRPW
jgi:Ca2+-binding EF-hand superfamily protein